MSGTAQTEPTEHIGDPGALEQRARAEADGHKELERLGYVPFRLASRRLPRALEQVRRRLVGSPPVASNSPPPGKAQEWFLDNYHLLRRAARQVAEELPRTFERHLPILAAGSETGKARVDAVARTLVAITDTTIDRGVLERFTRAYQEVTAFTIAELWALPTLLRRAVLRTLLSWFTTYLSPGEAHDGRSDLDASLVERCVRSLRELDVINWKDFFESMNRVEATLRQDPANVYARMDFATCDAYRKVVEHLAWKTTFAEEAVAELSVSLARAHSGDERRGHVGYFLLGEGRRELESKIAYRANGVESIRRLTTTWPSALFLGAIVLLTGSLLVLVAAATRERPLMSTIATLFFLTLPLSGVAITVLHVGFAHLLPPRVLPKLDFKSGVPADARTLVVIPTLLTRLEAVEAVVRRLELHYLSNQETELQFALLTDDVDVTTRGDEARTPSAPLEAAIAAVNALNAKHGSGCHGPFHLLHREPRWNESEGRLMGWERKRGKLEELNRLLRGATNTSYAVHVGDPSTLSGVRYVLTLDSDTELPLGSARRLIGLLAHPLNRPVFDPSTNRIVAGYSIVQPRIDTTPTTGRPTAFARTFAGDVGFDIYTHASSELYQDLFGSGIYVGKGLYDVDAFSRSLDGRVPENALVSHDLFEGVHGRAALATDIVLFESYPPNYASFALRLHRWIRGDWQLLPWLFDLVPSEGGKRIPNPLRMIDRWKILDNLRRSLTGPAILVYIILQLTLLQGSALAWTLVALTLLAAPVLPALAGGRRRALLAMARWGIAAAFLPYESYVSIDAIVRALVRMRITRKKLLEWTTAADTVTWVGRSSPRALYWRMMFPAPAIAALLLGLVTYLRPMSLSVAAPLVLSWLLAPELARWLSSSDPPRSHGITDDERSRLRLLARRTWSFFETFVGPIDQWLPIDNYQESPAEQAAHRTSPTNIGLLLLASASAYDFGYVGTRELILRLQRALDSINRLPHYQGHLLNWYDTRSLQPLLPRYVSTVDSGNFAGCLVAVKHACQELPALPVIRLESWEGLCDALRLLDEVVASSPPAARRKVQEVLARMTAVALRASRDLDESYEALSSLTGDLGAELDRELQAFLEAGDARHEPSLLRSLRGSIDRLRRQLEHLSLDIQDLAPWMSFRRLALTDRLDLPSSVALRDVPTLAERLLVEVATLRESGSFAGSEEVDLERLNEALRSSAANARALLADVEGIVRTLDAELRGMDFRLLYDTSRRLFHIGYNATSDQKDPHHYDLLASEARLASYWAIVKGDVPESHWYSLGRPLANLKGGPALLSWGGTMFEYLMPALLMRSQEGTLLARTMDAAVDAQIEYGRRRRQPWGISESAYARVDGSQTYQYRSFGVPGLGFKRGLEDDHVIAPYASILAVGMRPQEVVENLDVLEAFGMRGAYGLFEALDLTPGRVAEHGGQPGPVVRSYMAHHQGMAFVALGNLLNRRSMVGLFHEDPLVQTGEALLNERTPDRVPDEAEEASDAKVVEVSTDRGVPRVAPWEPDPQRPQLFVVTNGRLTSLCSTLGGGGLRWQGLSLTRYEVDPTLRHPGYFYFRDDDSTHIWSDGSRASRITCALHMCQLHLRENGISSHVDIAVGSADDVEVRQVTLHNETDRPRRISLVGAARPVLFDDAAANAHPAFANMFLVSEYVDALEGLLFARRSQNVEDYAAVLVHRVVHDSEAAVRVTGFETSREDFLGRAGTVETPWALSTGKPLGRRVGAVLDPIMAIMATVDLKPKGTVKLAYVTSVARSRSEALELARKYGTMHAVQWAFLDAEQDAPRRLQRLGLDAHRVPTIFRLLSALLFADSHLRAPASVRARVPASQRRLWGRGISGDLPIVLLHVEDPAAELVHEVLAAQRYLRASGFPIDVVLLDEHPSGYETEGAGMLRRVLVQESADEWIGRRGGVFPLVADQTNTDEISHLESACRVLLHTRDGSLLDCLLRLDTPPPKLPHFEATLPVEFTAEGPERPKLLMDNGLGGFTEDGREYVIFLAPSQVTPAPWANVLANPHFGCLVDESSFGPTWSQNSGENRLTPWRNDPVSDTPSEALYLRDEETAAVWSPTPKPAGRDVHTVIRHGAGYSIYERVSHGLEQALTVFVPVDASLKIVRLRLRNLSARHRRLTATYYAEWVLGNRRELRRPYIVSDFHRGSGCLFATCDWSDEFAGRVTFLATQGEVHGLTSDRLEFIGLEGDYSHPEGLTRWGLSGRGDGGTDPCGVLQVHVDLGPEEEKEVCFFLGQAPSRDEALSLVTAFRDSRQLDAAWRKLGDYWDEILGAIHVVTPEPTMDLMLNRWLIYQTLSARVFGRTGFYQSSGAFGYRDQLQDVMALLHAAPAIARSQIIEAARHQFESGDVLHWWHPPSGRGVRTRCSDDMAWLPYVTAEYVSATGDASILHEPIPFLRGDELKPGEHDRYAIYEHATLPASLFEHCNRALARALTAGAHGLPLMGDGDWNDGMNRVGALGAGESVWLAWFLCSAMSRFAALAELVHDESLAEQWTEKARALRALTRDVAWDGAWYLRAFHDDTSRVGSSKSRECRIDSIAQSWAVLSSTDPTSDSQARQAVKAADDALVRESERLILLFWPPFDSALHDPGYVRAYPPGVRENGGQYTHAATWLGLAHAALGDGDRAEHVFRLLNPVLRSQNPADAARYRIEPYVLAGDIYSCPPWVGRGGWSWYTGSAAWLWRLGAEAILGLRLEGGRLSINPCIPGAWKGFEATVRRNGQRVHIVVERSCNPSQGAVITLNGAKVDGSVISLPEGSSVTHEVVVRLGATSSERPQASPGKGGASAEEGFHSTPP